MFGYSNRHEQRMPSTGSAVSWCLSNTPAVPQHHIIPQQSQTDWWQKGITSLLTQVLSNTGNCRRTLRTQVLHMRSCNFTLKSGGAAQPRAHVHVDYSTRAHHTLIRHTRTTGLWQDDSTATQQEAIMVNTVFSSAMCSSCRAVSKLAHAHTCRVGKRVIQAASESRILRPAKLCK